MTCYLNILFDSKYYVKSYICITYPLKAPLALELVMLKDNITIES